MADITELIQKGNVLLAFKYNTQRSSHAVIHLTYQSTDHATELLMKHSLHMLVAQIFLLKQKKTKTNNTRNC